MIAGVFLNTGILASRAQPADRAAGRAHAAIHGSEIRAGRLRARATRLRAIRSLEELFDPDSVAAGGCIASRALLYDSHQQRDRWTLALAPRHGEPIVLDTAAGDVPQSRTRCATRCSATTGSRCPRCTRIPACSAANGPRATRRWHGRRSGIQRLEHASLLIASDTTRLLTDPISLAIGGNAARSRSRAVQPGPADRRHARHAWPSRPLACPDDPAARRRRIGARHRAAHPVASLALATTCSSRCVTSADGARARLGRRCGSATSRSTSCRSTASSRPSARRAAARRAQLGQLPGHDAAVLGDPARRRRGCAPVMDVIDQSVARRGRPDLLSCCRELRKAPFWQGLFTFWMVLPMTELQRLPRIAEAGDGPSITLGPDGIGELLRTRARARAVCERVLRHRHRDRRHRLDQRRPRKPTRSTRCASAHSAAPPACWLPGATCCVTTATGRCPDFLPVDRVHDDWQQDCADARRQPQHARRSGRTEASGRAGRLHRSLARAHALDGVERYGEHEITVETSQPTPTQPDLYQRAPLRDRTPGATIRAMQAQGSPHGVHHLRGDLFDGAGVEGRHHAAARAARLSRLDAALAAAQAVLPGLARPRRDLVADAFRPAREPERAGVRPQALGAVRARAVRQRITGSAATCR